MAALRRTHSGHDYVELIRFFLMTFLLTAALTFIVGSALLDRG